MVFGSCNFSYLYQNLVDLLITVLLWFDIIDLTLFMQL